MLNCRNILNAGVLAASWLVMPVFSQAGFWPAVLNVPTDSTAPAAEDTVTATTTDDAVTYDSSDIGTVEAPVVAPPGGDSTDVSLSGGVSLYQTFKMRSRLDWQQRLSGGALNQCADYRYQQINPQNRIQSLDLSGSIVRHDLFLPGLTAGIDWTPIASYNMRQYSTMQSSADIGPVVSHSLFKVPFTVRGGLYGYASGDSIGAIHTPPLSRYHGDPGIYAGCSIGTPDSSLGGLPLYVSVNAQGRSIKGNNLGLFYGSLLYADKLQLFKGNDSIFVHIGDSITNGKELFIGDFTGASLFSNTSWRINHSLSGAAGIKGQERLGIRPQVYYRYVLHSIAYPTKGRTLDDVRTTRNTFGLALQSDEHLSLTYRGGIEFAWEFEDWLYRHNFDGIQWANSGNRDSLIINQSDHFSDIARSAHELTIRLPRGLSAKYRFNAFKDSKRYPFEFVNEQDSFQKNQNENDRVQFDQRLSMRYDRDTLLFMEIFGEYKRLYHYYYRKQRSAESRTTQEYRVGLECGYSTDGFDFREQLSGSAEVSEYHFRRVGKPPPYSRDVTSTLSARWKVRQDRLHLIGKWVEMYHDDGAWYGNGYLPDSSAPVSEYYAIERKGTQYWLDFAVETIFNTVKVTPGCLLRDVFPRIYDRTLSKYVVSSLDLGYDIEPYVRFEAGMERLLLKLRIKRIINTQDVGRWDIKKNWDMAMSLQMVF